VLDSFTARFARGVGAVKPATALAIVATVARVNFILNMDTVIGLFVRKEDT
jgi:hypothetical protein